MKERWKLKINMYGLIALFLMLLVCVGCSNTIEEGRVSGVGGIGGSTEIEENSKDTEGSTLQEELRGIEDWDKELMSLLDRVGDCEKEWLAYKVTEEQARWKSMLDYADDIETLKKNRCYVLASDLAQIKGEDFNMLAEPILFVDDQGTDEVYSFMEIDEERKYAKIVFYRLGEIDGKLSENTDGSFEVASIDGSVKGTLTLYGHHGWNGANFIIDEVIDNSVFEKGERVTFNLAY